MSVQLISGLIGFLLTVMVLSYLIGDNLLFRLATYIFVGVSAGYIATIAIRQVILPFLGQFNLKMDLGLFVLLLIPVLFSVLILMKISPRLSWLGGPAVGYLVGVSAAVAIGGAVLGTLLPQIAAAAQPFDVFGPNNQGVDPLSSAVIGGIMLVGTITTLAYFQFGAHRQLDGSVKRNFIVNIFAWAGQLFIAITFGVLFAGVYSAALTALIERIDSIRSFIALFFQ
jgi:hypothetical protein